jgi:VWFA-related protein
MMHTRIPFFLALMALGICLIARDASTQQPANPAPPADNAQPQLKNQAYDVVLPVTVRDKKGALVTTLQKSDLTLTEEGRPQTIKSFSRDANLPFRLGLLIQTNRAMSGALEPERKALEKFVDAMLPAQSAEGKDANQAFLIHFDREVELVQDFTGSREKLHAELDDMGATRQSQNDTKGPETTGEDRSDRVHGSRAGNQLYDAIFLASDEVMGSKNGRKALILFSDGVDRGSKDRLNEALDAAEKAHTIIYTVYFKGEQEKEAFDYPDRGSHRGGWPGGGGGYPGGGGGYPNGGGRRGGDRGPSETGVDGRKIMQQIAERTGGHAYDARKRDDLEPIYNLIAEDLRSQYLLTYTPDKPDNEGGFHKVSLKANKDEFSVSIPEGWFAPGGDTSR